MLYRYRTTARSSTSKTLMESALKRDGSFAWSHLTFHSNRKILTVLVVQQQHNQPVDILVFSEVPIGVELQQQNLNHGS